MVSNFRFRIRLLIITVAIWGNFDVALSQVPEIEWESNYGGSGGDYANSIQVTQDGGYIIAGWSFSDDGDVSGNNGSYGDYWVVKVDGSGNIEWEANYGGSDDDQGRSIQVTEGGGYILAGYSESDDIDVSGNNGDSNFYDYYDYWVVKLDGSGNIEWESNYGGGMHEEANSIQTTDDGGYIVAGYSESDDVDVSENNGLNDYWILKLDSTGNIVWEGSYGGNGYDKANSIQTTDDGGFIVAGSSNSDAGDVSGNNGYYDYWIVKLDSLGMIEWEGNYGGSDEDYANSIQVTDDGGYVVAGHSRSDDGDVTGNNGMRDIWILKLDSIGNIKWEVNYGGSQHDEANSIQTTYDGGYIVAGVSWSDDGDVSEALGGYWILKLDDSGNIEWEEKYDGDDANHIQATADGGFIVAGDAGSAWGDVSGNNGESDFWVVKLSGDGSSGGGGGDDGNGGGTTTDLLYEDFDEAEFPPTGWDRVVTNQSQFWYPGASQDWGFNAIDPDDIGSAAIDWVAQDQDEWMISPEVDLTTVSDPQLSFYVLHGTTYLSNAVMKLNISIDANHESWSELWRTEDDGGGFEWRKIEIDLGAYVNESSVKLGWQYIGNDGNSMALDSIYVFGNGQTSTSFDDEIETPQKFLISQNYPNPFNPTTQIRYELPEASKVTIKVYDLLGREISTLVNGRRSAGRHQETFDASSLSSGIYIYRIEAGNYIQTRKMTLIK